MRRLPLLIPLLLLGLPAQADPPPNYPFVSYDEGLRLAQGRNKRVFLYFGRYGCGWCDKTNKEAFSDEALRKLYTDHYVLVYVDAESGARLTLPSGERVTEMDLGVRYGAFATPLFAYLESDGKLIFKIPGIQSAADFRAYDRFVTGRYYRKQDIRQFLEDR